MKYFVEVDGRTFEVEVGPGGVTVDGEPADADLARVPDTDLHHLLLDRGSWRIGARRGGSGRWELEVGGRRVAAEAVDERTRTIREMTGAGAGPAGPRPVVAPMPGLVVKVEVEEGDEVEAGQGIVIVEAMKMENELRAEAGGRVARVLVASGDTVEKDQVLVELAAPGGDGAGEGA